ncbi:hypothetical protein SAMD00019534_094130 [Acytostelium subglobosum LB1]|uniref:hypothetical protein n=1 Tax=Acytostelium subglobosum LB1 TaxID=1410327 RepID=UPI000644CB4B|nr:hypothetical protein SAMD00019534_094130 [Acytostelium subglobosum LB1]GAM26238.1 hypothetical protein SAMD00019534_094130 [Acytostelium subglobosum LB1]|eukprot:XP_012750792.1 hypothetical protein SAMD00019534_094130 [Acytostelium subglobosum LB1]
MASYVGGLIVLTVVLVGFLYLIFSDQTRAGRQTRVFDIITSVASACLMTLGFIPQLMVVYRAKSGMGISKLFIVLDMLGGIFAIISLGFRQPFDYLAMLTYVVVPAFQSIQLAMVVYYGDGDGNNVNGEGNVESKVGRVQFDNVKVVELEMDMEMSTHKRQSIEEEEDEDDSLVGVGADVVRPAPLSHTTTIMPIDSLIASRAILQPLSLSRDFNEQVNIRAHPKIFTSLLSSSRIVPAVATETHEFDHIMPESESDSEDTQLKRSITLHLQHLRSSTSSTASAK